MSDRSTQGGPNVPPNAKRDVDPGQGPAGQNKPVSQGGLAGSQSGDRNSENHPGYVTNDTNAPSDPAASESWAERDSSN